MDRITSLTRNEFTARFAAACMIESGDSVTGGLLRRVGVVDTLWLDWLGCRSAWLQRGGDWTMAHADCLPRGCRRDPFYDRRWRGTWCRGIDPW